MREEPLIDGNWFVSELVGNRKYGAVGATLAIAEYNLRRLIRYSPTIPNEVVRPTYDK